MIVVPVVVLGLFLAGVNWAATRVVSVTIGRKHRVLEELLNTGQVPAQWRQRYERRVRLPGRRQEPCLDAKRHYLAWLDDLERYVQNTTLVADEETRETVLEQLDAIRASWENDHGYEF